MNIIWVVGRKLSTFGRKHFYIKLFIVDITVDSSVTTSPPYLPPSLPQIGKWIKNKKSTLLAQRRKFIPPDPKVMIEINIDLPVFLTKAGENVIKGDQVLADGRRIILFTTKEHLKILARARQILGDGTFRITPGLWCQTFVQLKSFLPLVKSPSSSHQVDRVTSSRFRYFISPK